MKWTLAIGAFLISCLIQSGFAHAASGRGKGPGDRGPAGEISAMGSLSKTDYGNSTYSTSRHYTLTVGLNVTPTTEIELSYANTASFLNEDPIQTSNTSEQSLGLSVVQTLLPPRGYLQPYVKGGAAQYNRQQSGTVAGIPSTPVQTKSPSGILGAGLRVFLVRNFSLKGEGVTYLPNFHISAARSNFSLQVGVSWEF